MTNKPTPIPPKNDPPSDPPKVKPSKAADKRTVSEHGAANYPGPAPRGGQKGVGRPHPELWMHNAAATLHRWGQHAHHMAAEMVLSDDDYAAAIKAALKPNAKGNYIPHTAALFVMKKA